MQRKESGVACILWRGLGTLQLTKGKQKGISYATYGSVISLPNLAPFQMHFLSFF